MEKPRPRDVNKFPKVIGPVNGSQNLRPGSLALSHSSFSPPSPVSFPRSPTPLSPVSPTLVPTLPPQGLGLPPLTGSAHTCPVYTCPPSPAHNPLFQAWPSRHLLRRALLILLGDAPRLRGFLGWRLSCQTSGNLPQSRPVFSDSDLQTFIFSLPVCLHQALRRGPFVPFLCLFCLLLFPGTLE